MSSISFRKDINGLRAIAVLAVVTYHFMPSYLSGGFTGVDVFFVISGFLMTAIIYRGLETSSFSLLRFYAARVRRIIPPLLVLLLVLFTFGFFFLSPPYNKVLNDQIHASTAFISNHLFMKDSGYFSSDVRERWLLHTWSLAVEFQFYIFYPILCMILKRIAGLKGVKIGITLGALVGLLFSTIYTFKNPTAAFYLFPSRSWEMLLGGVIFLFPLSLNERKKIYLEVIGISMIVTACYFFSGSMLWPYYYAVLPVFGAGLIISACRNNSFLTSNFLFQQIGNASYSIYLWHWPVFVFLSFFDLIQPTTILVGILSSFLLGSCSYHLIECKIKRHAKNHWVVPVTLFCAIILGSGSALIAKGKYSSPIPYDERYAFSPLEYHHKFYGGTQIPTVKIFSEGTAKKQLLITGDSYSRQYGNALTKKTIQEKFSFTAFFHDGCLIFPDITRFVKKVELKTCSSSYEKLQTMLDQNPSAPLVIAYSWSGYKNGLGVKGGAAITFDSDTEYYSTISQQLEKVLHYGGSQRNYYLIARPQPAASTIKCLSKSDLIFGKTCPKMMPRQNIPENIWLEGFASNKSNVYVIDPNQVLCTDKGCMLTTPEGNPIRSDGTHLSIFGAAPVVDFILDELLENKPYNIKM